MNELILSCVRFPFNNPIFSVWYILCDEVRPFVWNNENTQILGAQQQFYFIFFFASKIQAILFIYFF